MIYVLYHMSKRWIARKVEDIDDLIEDHIDNIMEIVSEGTVVAMSDDLETFADEMGINVGEIKVVTDEDDDDER